MARSERFAEELKEGKKSVEQVKDMLNDVAEALYWEGDDITDLQVLCVCECLTWCKQALINRQMAGWGNK